MNTLFTTVFFIQYADPTGSQITGTISYERLLTNISNKDGCVVEHAKFTSHQN